MLTKNVLNANWVKSAIHTSKWIHEAYSDDIKEVVWDTPAGRALIDAEGHGTSADMFVKLKNGRRVGISLKVNKPKITKTKLITEATTGLFIDRSVKNICF